MSSIDLTCRPTINLNLNLNTDEGIVEEILLLKKGIQNKKNVLTFNLSVHIGLEDKNLSFSSPISWWRCPILQKVTSKAVNYVETNFLEVLSILREEGNWNEKIRRAFEISDVDTCNEIIVKKVNNINTDIITFDVYGDPNNNVFRMILKIVAEVGFK